MALQQTITNEKGATTTYHRIVKANLDFNAKTASLIVFSYATESLRQVEKDDLISASAYNDAVKKLDELIANPTEENEQERIRLTKQINSSTPPLGTASLHLTETEYSLPLNEDFSIKDAYKWLKDNIYTDAVDVQTVTLTVEQMPTHNHAQYVGSQYGSWGVRRDYAGDGNCASYPQGTTGSTGGSAPHDNLPPYKTTYFWQRTA